MVENIFRHLAHHTRRAITDPEASLTDKLRRVLAAAVEVDKSILFSVIITIAAFLPLFTMQGVEGQIFGPMARTYAYALIGAVVATFTVTPVLASILLPEKVQEIETILVRGIRRVYLILLPLAVRNARIAGDDRGGIPDRRRRARRAARHRVPAEARRGQSLDSRGDAADHHARGRPGDRRRHPQGHHGIRPGADGRLRAGPRRRRHRSGRLVPRRVLRAVEAAGRMAQGPDQDPTGRSDERETQFASSSASTSTSRNTSRTTSKRRCRA